MSAMSYDCSHYLIQVSPSCLQVAQYKVKLDLIYSSETILVNYTVGSGQQVLEIIAPNIEENELYNTTVGIEDLPASESTSIQLSECNTLLFAKHIIRFKIVLSLRSCLLAIFHRYFYCAARSHVKSGMWYCKH